MKHTRQPETLEAIRQLPALQRLPYVERIRVVHPQLRTILDEIRSRHQARAITSEPPCLLLLGQTGAGKSTLIETYAQDYPASFTPEGKVMPVVRATIFPPATVKGLAITILSALGDPAASSGTTTTLTERLIRLFDACGVELLILDELQHFVDRDSAKVLLTVSNWLKTVIKETRVACVLVGLVGEAELVVDTNPQLGRLFGDPVVLEPFRWDATDPASIRLFRTLLQTIERQLPLQQASQLDSPELAQRIFVATEGVLGYVMALVRRATWLALEQGQEALSQAVLAQAFDLRLGGQRRTIANPFVGALPPVPPPGARPGSTPSRASKPARRARTRA